MRNLLIIIICHLIPIVGSAQSHSLSLAGDWSLSFRHPDSTHVVEAGTVSLPGSMLTNGKGYDVGLTTQWTGSLYDSSFYFNPRMAEFRQPGNIKFPFFLTPDKHFIGHASYRRSFSVPKSWRKQRLFLSLERAHIETTLLINGKVVGRDSSLSVPHEFEITDFVKFGKENSVELRIYNGIEDVCVGKDSHSVTDQTQGNWNGAVGRLEVITKPEAFIADLQVFPNVTDKSVVVRFAMDDDGRKGKALKGKTYDVVVKVEGCGFDTDIRTVRASLKCDDNGMASVSVPMGDDVRLWDEFTPNLYSLRAIVGQDTATATFGMRSIEKQGRQLYINGRKTWMRGTVENCCFPLTGFPPMNEQEWTDIFLKCKEYGLNHMRFHSYCPPEAAFAAADKVGFYLQPEGPSWPNHGVRLGRGEGIDTYLWQETERMVRAYGNHPSFCFLAAGNEPAGNWVSWVSDFVERWKATGDDRRLYCGASVGGSWAFDPKSDYHVKGSARGLAWNDAPPQSTDDFYAQITSFTQKGRKPVTFDIVNPYLSHEQGQWCAFPDLDETVQYTGAYKAKNFEIFRSLLRDNGMEHKAKDFLMASGKLQTLAYKFETERNLRTPEYAGFQYLSLNDYSGQGTALVGVLNVFWREKGYCTSADWRQFCSPVVPLAKFDRFVFSQSDTMDVAVEIVNAFSHTLSNVRSRFIVHDDSGKECASGLLSQKDIEVGKCIPLGRVTMPLAALSSPKKYRLTVLCETAEQEELPLIYNGWDFWVYPAKLDEPKADGIYIATTLDSTAIATLERGGKVLLTAAGKIAMGSDVKQAYLPVFWNTSWFKMRPPHTTGATIDAQHPLFRNFPTDDWGNLNWWELLNGAKVVNMGEFPKEYMSPIQPIDTWHISRKLGMLVEANVLRGKLILTTMDIDSDLEHRLVARQMRAAIIAYMRSKEFRPTISLTPDFVKDLYVRQAPRVDMFTSDAPDEIKMKNKQ